MMIKQSRFLLLLTLVPCLLQAQQTITLKQAVQLAQSNDPWLHGSKLKQTAMEHKSVASGSLPDPNVSISMANIPVDSWDLDQEGMTQFKVGVSQMFPRGDSLAIKERQLTIEASVFPLLRADRKAKLQAMVSELWLDAFLAQQTITLIESDRALFEQMAEVARASYSNAIGKTRQQDVIRAQLEIVQLEDRLQTEKLAYESAMTRLSEWLHRYDQTNFEFSTQPVGFLVSESLPQIKLKSVVLSSFANTYQYDRNELAAAFSQHPAIMAIDVKRKASEQGVELAKQQYKPKWGLNASYGYRNDMPSGAERAGLFSVGITFDVPLFTKNRQDQVVSASIAESQAIKTEKLLVTKQMMSAVEKELKQLNRLSHRQSIYQQQLLTQMHDQAEASLTAYTNDDGDFAEVVRARIAELNARIAALKIDVETLKTVARINYYFATNTSAQNLENDYAKQ